ncbi:MAG: transcription-repair coupling factor [Nitrospirota bacterium]|nr:transcription-repair coupling factor [Nitrospirota bacterium]
MNQLQEILQQPLQKLLSDTKTIELSELWGGSRGLMLLELFRETKRHLLVVTANEEEADAFAADLRFLARAMPGSSDQKNPSQPANSQQTNIPHVASTYQGEEDILVFPGWGVLPFEADSPDSATVGERMSVLYRLVSGGPCIVVAPASALMQKLPPWELFADAVRTINSGSTLDPDAFADSLISIGYEHASLVTRIGEFSRRGGIIDIFSPAHPNPLRFEFFGDVVESLREFDPETQRSLGTIKQAVALPVRELIQLRNADCGLRIEKQEDKNEKRAQISQEQQKQIEEGTFPPGAEFLAPFFYTMDPLVRYFPETSVIALIEPDDITKVLNERTAKIEQGRAEEIAENRTLPEAKDFYLDAETLFASLAPFRTVQLRLLAMSGDTIRMDTRSSSYLNVRLTKAGATPHDHTVQETGEGTVTALSEKLKRLREQNRVFLVCGTEDAANRLFRMFTEYGVPISRKTAIDLDDNGPWTVAVMTGRLTAGFSWPSVQLVMITDEEIFGSKVHRPRQAKSKAAPFLSSFKELKPGDFVVHTDYGVGEYQGLTHLAVDGFETDFLTLRYEPDAKLYVPLYSLDKVQKYTGTEGSPPKVNKLGAPTWQRTKEKIKKDILMMAQELVAIYAAREAMQRSPLSAPDNLYREFESAFPFEETPDQQKAIEDVLEDMQKPRPMDRLVCGDVGFGKTEVALRAAFKAVEDGFQAAVIVPTTLLADQHFRTFSERVAPFSITVDLMSRFRTKSEQKETLRKLKAGTVDIVIGTHRLLQRDIAFRNLGLLVIDEEHRFGVKHKERIKEMRKMVDVLTLTATPIPRTLHMSLSGIRDLSIIQTPPLDRQAIQVVLARFGKRVIREAVMQELDRGGQVFFVQNRVAGIERMAAYIQNLVPAARIGVAHGQMQEEEIEEVMSKFVAAELNVLVTTTIIESGIDIPNANTIIINRADRFGLAELYQIKGRVGRSRRKAYAYLLTPEEEALSDIARTRLRAIQELSELGAGFRIAAQDLESRGAGNLLGKQQSGHIAAVGIDLYTEMMEEAMAELRGEEISQEPDTQINLRASAYIPESYIYDVSLRLQAYKEISAAAADTALDDIAEGLRDRYGELPEPAANLIEIMKIKLLARSGMVSRIDGSTDSVSVTFSENAPVAPDRVMAYIRRSKGTVRLVPEYTLRIAVADQSLKAASEAVKKCLQELR